MHRPLYTVLVIPPGEYIGSSNSTIVRKGDFTMADLKSPANDNTVQLLTPAQPNSESDLPVQNQYRGARRIGDLSLHYIYTYVANMAFDKISFVNKTKTYDGYTNTVNSTQGPVVSPFNCSICRSEKSR